ncbi:hypothetical protein NBRC111894_3875 [Sporolactobacillus inulinus]|uniref:Uncharacterized protein n=1 Tax=Sporolactobacillus inulinus TaxID=2078 RepID=A0A4Y1ZH92_9BACL|nr:hypothetical protein NBRC111894_3875 [Sporolactobacillus inulinus]
MLLITLFILYLQWCNLLHRSQNTFAGLSSTRMYRLVNGQ